MSERSGVDRRTLLAAGGLLPFAWALGGCSLKAPEAPPVDEGPAPSTPSAVKPGPPMVVDPAQFGARADGSTDDTRAWQAAIAAVPRGGTIDGKGRPYLVTTLVVDRPVTVRNAAFTRLTAGDIVQVTASDVVVDHCTIAGPGGAVAGRSCGLRATDVTRLTVRNSTVSAIDYQGIQLNRVAGFTIENCVVSDIAYAGIMLLSCTDGQVSGCEVWSISQPRGFINSYGISVSRAWGLPLDQAPHSERITVTRNRVHGVPLWEGLDTHGGRSITFSDNDVFDCLVGIAAVPGKGIDGEAAYAPLDCRIVGNTVDSGVDDGSRRSGIAITGATHSSGHIVEPATGVVLGNTIRRHGAQGSAAGAGVLLTCTLGVNVSNNDIQECSPTGITLARDNWTSRVSGNRIVDVWSSSSRVDTAAVRVQPRNNNAEVTGNSLTRGSKSARQLNHVGLDLGIGNPAVRSDRNDFAAASHAVAP